MGSLVLMQYANMSRSKKTKQRIDIGNSRKTIAAIVVTAFVSFAVVSNLIKNRITSKRN